MYLGSFLNHRAKRREDSNSICHVTSQAAVNVTDKRRGNGYASVEKEDRVLNHTQI